MRYQLSIQQLRKGDILTEAVQLTAPRLSLFHRHRVTQHRFQVHSKPWHLPGHNAYAHTHTIWIKSGPAHRNNQKPPSNALANTIGSLVQKQKASRCTMPNMLPSNYATIRNVSHLGDYAVRYEPTGITSAFGHDLDPADSLSIRILDLDLRTLAEAEERWRRHQFHL